MTDKKVFIAIHISEELQREIVFWTKAFLNVPARWTAGKDFHITLVPPWRENDIESVAERMKVVKRIAEPFSIEFHKVSCGPNPARPRFIWAQGPLSKKLAGLHDALVNIFKERRSELPFRPHITLARFNSRHFSSFQVKRLDEKVYWRETVDSIVLMESPMDTDAGSGYHVLHKIDF